MKKTLFLLLFIVAGLTLLFNNSFGQSPQLINYQAVAHNTSGQLVENQNISVRISILSGTATGTTEYSETHAVTTNQFGIFTIQIGGGSIISGAFTAINWASAPHFVKVEADETGGSNYQLLGTSQLVSVPYALYSENAGKAINDQDTSTTNELQTLSINSYDLSISNGNSVALPTGFSGNYNDLSNTPTIPTNVSQLANDAGYVVFGGFSNFQVFEITGSFTVPAGVTKIMVEAWGAGGGGGYISSQGNCGGGGGGYGKGIYTVSAGTNYVVTIGNGGYGSSTNGQDGGNSCFGSLICANGGKGGYTGGRAGGTSTATINISGQFGIYASSAAGGSSPNGGFGGLTGTAPTDAQSPGGGGYGGQPGSNGAIGRIIVWW